MNSVARVQNMNSSWSLLLFVLDTPYTRWICMCDGVIVRMCVFRFVIIYIFLRLIFVSMHLLFFLWEKLCMCVNSFASFWIIPFIWSILYIHRIHLYGKRQTVMTMLSLYIQEIAWWVAVWIFRSLLFFANSYMIVIVIATQR